jgi:hypothetical protein
MRDEATHHSPHLMCQTHLVSSHKAPITDDLLPNYCISILRVDTWTNAGTIPDESPVSSSVVEGTPDEDDAAVLGRQRGADDAATPWDAYFDEARDIDLPNGRGRFR